MHYVYCIYTLFFLTTQLLIFTYAKKSFYSISNVGIASIFYNGSKASFCTVDKNDLCINRVTIQFDNTVIPLHENLGYSGPLNLAVDDDNFSISATVSYRSDTNETTWVKALQPKFLNINSSQIAFDFPSNMFTFTVNLKIACQTGYLQSTCNVIELCPKLPSNMCRNNGTCVQEKNTIKCTCVGEFVGDYCDEPKYPCVDNLCGVHSACILDYTNDKKYRCDCKKGFTGPLCREIIDPCAENYCRHNATCHNDKDEKIGYRCQCQNGYNGTFCEQTIDHCDNNQCTQYINATCISTRDNYVCHCDDGCKKHSDVILPFKWPFNDLITFLFVVLEGVVIIVLIVLLIFIKAGCCRSKEKRHKSYLDDHILSMNTTKSDKECIEFGTNYARHPIHTDDIGDNNNSNHTINNSLNPMFDLNEMQSFSNNHLLLDNTGMSTFGRR